MSGWTVASLALALPLALALSRAFRGYPERPEGLSRLGRGEAAFLAAVADAMFPPGGALSASGRDADIPRYVDRLAEASQPRIRRMFHALFWLMEHATLVFPASGRGGWRRFSSLDLDRRVAVLDAWEGSRLFPRRLAFFSLRSLCAMAFLAHPPVLRDLGLAPFAIDTPRCPMDRWAPRVGRSRASIALGPAEVAERPASGIPLALDGPLHPGWRADTDGSV